MPSEDFAVLNRNRPVATPAAALGVAGILRAACPGARTYKVLHHFEPRPPLSPRAALIRGGLGNFYGTTAFGASEHGAFFKLDTSRTLTTLHSFNGSDGAAPYSVVIRDGSGNLYGTTVYGGASNQGTD